MHFVPEKSCLMDKRLLLASYGVGIRMGSFGGLGAEPPTAGGLAPAGSRGRRPRRGSRGRSPFASLSPLIADLSF